MRRWLEIGVLMASLVGLGACGQGTVQNALGMGKRSPDEFAVVSRAPLIMPPDYGLRPPGPGESRPGIATTSEQARASLVGTPTDGPPPEAGQPVLAATLDLPPAPKMTAAEQALVAEATTTPSDPQIRTKIADENVQLAAVEQELFTRLIEWRQPSTLGTTINPEAETQRLRTNRAAGKPPTAGNQVVIVQNRTSVLQGWIKEML